VSRIIVNDLTPTRIHEPGVCESLIPQSNDDLALQDACLLKLWDHYPGATWRVDVNGKRGTVDVFCMNLSGRWGVRWKIGRIYGDPNLYWIKMAGGELMERANIARGRFDEDTADIRLIEGIDAQDQPMRGMPI
jgi:hypothetical protein